MPAWNNHRRRCHVPPEKRCEALLRDCWLAPTNNRCRCYAHFLIGGKQCCSKHAAMLALEIAEQEGKAKEIQVSYPTQRFNPRWVNEDEI